MTLSPRRLSEGGIMSITFEGFFLRVVKPTSFYQKGQFVIASEIKKENSGFQRLKTSLALGSLGFKILTKNILKYTAQADEK